MIHLSRNAPTVITCRDAPRVARKNDEWVTQVCIVHCAAAMLAAANIECHVCKSTGRTAGESLSRPRRQTDAL
jgi:hypothetical protein